ERDSYNETTTLVAKSAGNNEFFRFYSGAADQAQDPTIVTYLGAQAPAYRDTSYLVFTELPLTEYGGVLPAMDFDIVNGTTGEESTFVLNKALSMQDWLGGVDPRNPSNDHQYRSNFGSGTWHSTLEAALSESNAYTGINGDPSLLVGWRHYTGSNEID